MLGECLVICLSFTTTDRAALEAERYLVSIAESVGERWFQSAENALFSAQNGLKMHADMR